MKSRYRLGSFSQDPIGFSGGDANLYRYVGNGPTTKTDPSGLDAVLVIYIQTANMPVNFDSDAIYRRIIQILRQSGSRARVVVIPTSREIPASERGWEDDDTSYFWASGYWNFNPLTWVTSGIHDCYTEIRDGLTDEERWYAHSVSFTSPRSARWLANTPGTTTQINLTGLNQHAAGAQGNVDWDVLYANILMHEVIYLGLLGNFDDPRATGGAFSSASASVRTPMTLTPDERDAIDDALNCD